MRSEPTATPRLEDRDLGRGYVLVGLLLAAAFLVTEGWLQNTLYVLTGSLAVAAILVGVVRHGPPRRAPWLLLAASQAAFVVGDAVWSVVDHVGGESPFPGPADVVYLLGYPMMMAGLVLLQDHHARQDRGAVVESGIIALGLGMAGWVFLVAPAWAASEGALAARLVSTAYPAMDVLLVALVLRTLLLLQWRSPALRLLLASVLVMATADVAYLFTSVAESYQAGGWEDVGWLASYVLVGAAALHPTMASARRPVRAVAPPAGRVGLLAGGLLVAPGLMVWQDVHGASSAGLLAAWIALTALVAVRTAGLLAELSDAATYDELTGLLSRTASLAHLRHVLDRLAHGQDAGVVVAFLGMEGFKLVNDGVGHDAGDQLLAEVAQRLRRACGGAVRAGRLGGDEFVVVANGVGEDDDVEPLVDRLRTVVEEPFEVGPERLYLQARVGAVRAAPGVHEVSELLRSADRAMGGTRRLNPGTPGSASAGTDRRALDDLRLRSSLRQAVPRRELRLHYQPEVEVATGRLFGFEALLRWQHPDRGLLGPAAFIDAAEETGDICTLGAWAFDEACRQLRRWLDAEPPGPESRSVTMSVNVSVRQLVDRSLPGVVERALANSGLDASLVTVEVTESALLADVASGVATLRHLRSLGASVAIDDFGTGYSSLGQLRRFPVDVLKIDRSFVQGLADSDEDRAVVAAIVTLAHALGIRAIAEGVESASQFAVLAELGCDLAQGYLLARPLPPDSVEEDLVALEERWVRLAHTSPSVRPSDRDHRWFAAGARSARREVVDGGVPR